MVINTIFIRDLLKEMFTIMETVIKDQFYLINAFTNTSFKGNPAAIIYLNKPKSEEWMQHFATEMNQPISTFIVFKSENHYELRWFTPKQEINLCGHGTLGAAHILWSQGYSKNESLHFHTKSGMISAEKINDSIKLQLKIKQTSEREISEELKNLVNTPIKAVAWAEDRYILELENEEMIHQVKPNLEAIKNIEGTGIIITSRGTDDYDFVSRVFVPKLGIDEDYVTGSAHCALAFYWRNILNKQEFKAYQASERGGIIDLKVHNEDVELIANCITILDGTVTE